MRRTFQEADHDIISTAREACEHLEGSDDWHEAVESKIIELAPNSRIARACLAQLNTQLARACGLI